MNNRCVPRLDSISTALYHWMAAVAVALILVNANALAAETVKSGTETAALPPNGMTERELYLLNEIELLKNRLVDLESRLTNGSPKPTIPLSATSATMAPRPAASAETPLPSPVNSASAAPTQDAPQAASVDTKTPFAFGDFTWLNGNPRTKDSVLDSKYFTGEFRVDTSYIHDYNHPIDHTLTGTTEGTRTGEFQVQDLGVGGDFHAGNMQGRFLTQFGMYSTATPRNDASPSVGQWNLSDAYRYVSEAYGGYHLDVQHGINIQAGIFMSYIGLFSYYNFDNWTYQPSYVSSNTPWFFNGVRVQWFPTNKLKIEPWLINGWQSYGKFNGRPGIGAQILYRPTEWLSFVGNQYGVGDDTVGLHRSRWHTDDSVEVKYYDKPARLLDKMALSLTIDLGCETGGGVSCTGGKKGPAQNFVGFMLYNRWWLHKDLFGVTIGGGAMDNPGRYLVLLPPINGATAASGTPYFTQNPGNSFKAWDTQATFDYMPSQWVTWRFEYTHRASNVPYFSGEGGVTPPGGNIGPLGSFVSGWTPDLRKRENRIIIALLVKL